MKYKPFNRMINNKATTRECNDNRKEF